MSTATEKRETTRLTIETAVIISDKAKNRFRGEIQNLSATGALIRTSGHLKPGIKYCLSIQLRGNSSNLTINDLRATVVRHTGDSVAVEFSDTMEWLTLFYIYKRKLNISKKRKLPNCAEPDSAQYSHKG